MNLSGDSGGNQLKNKLFIRNYGGNNWGEYVTNENVTVPQLRIDITGMALIHLHHFKNIEI